MTITPSGINQPRTGLSGMDDSWLFNPNNPTNANNPANQGVARSAAPSLQQPILQDPLAERTFGLRDLKDTAGILSGIANNSKRERLRLQAGAELGGFQQRVGNDEMGAIGGVNTARVGMASNVNDNSTRLQTSQDALNARNKQQQYNKGTARVPGKDRGKDTVPAMLRPGEAVLTKEAMEQPGMREFVQEMNKKHAPKSAPPMVGGLQAFAKGTEDVKQDPYNSAVQNEVPIPNNILARAFPGVSAVASQSGPSIREAYEKGGAGAAIGETARAATAYVPAVASDLAQAVVPVKRYLLDPAAQALKTAVTGDATPIGQEASPKANQVAAGAPASGTGIVLKDSTGGAAIRAKNAAVMANSPAEPTSLIDYARDSKAMARSLGVDKPLVLQRGDYAEQGGIVSGKNKKGQMTVVGMGNADVQAREDARVAQVAHSMENQRKIAVAKPPSSPKEEGEILDNQSKRMTLAGLAKQDQFRAIIANPKASEQERQFAAASLRQMAGKDDNEIKTAAFTELGPNDVPLHNTVLLRNGQMIGTAKGLSQGAGGELKHQPAPIDPAKRVVGQTYTNPSGQTAIWTAGGWKTT